MSTDPNPTGQSTEIDREAVIAAICATRLTIKVEATDDALVVSAHRDAAAGDSALATKTVPRARGHRGEQLPISLTSYPHPQVLEDLAWLAEGESLAKAVRQVGDTGIAEVVGRENFLSVARRVCTGAWGQFVDIKVYPLEEAWDDKRLLDTGYLAGAVGEMKVRVESTQTAYRSAETTYPYETAGDGLPDISADPVLGPAIRALNGA